MNTIKNEHGESGAVLLNPHTSAIWTRPRSGVAPSLQLNGSGMSFYVNGAETLQRLKTAIDEALKEPA